MASNEATLARWSLETQEFKSHHYLRAINLLSGKMDGVHCFYLEDNGENWLNSFYDNVYIVVYSEESSESRTRWSKKKKKEPGGLDPAP